MAEIANTLFNGLSLGSIYLLVALGLSVTFGLMGIINMAHGEFVMIGAYMAYVMQQIFAALFGRSGSLYYIAAIPFAFVITFLLGCIMERTLVTRLYGRKWTVCLQHGASASYCSRLQEAYLAHRVSMSMRLIF